MSEIICHCFEVSREEIENAIREKGLKTVEEVGEATNAGTGCGGCQEQIQEILDEINGKYRSFGVKSERCISMS